MPRAPTTPTPEQAWLLALGAPLRVVNDGHPDLLGGGRRGAPYARRILETVVGDVRTAEPLRAMLESTIAGPRRARPGAARSADGDALRDDEDVAWDLGRVAAWAGYGYVAGLLEAGDAWGYLQRAARLARHRYRSWSEWGEAYVAGRRRWKKRAGVRDRDEVTIRAQLLTSPRSPWNTLPWELDVTAAPPLAWTARDLIVDADAGPWRTIASALEDAFDGERIVVRPGTYRENLVTSRDVELVGEGEATVAPECFACVHVTDGTLHARGLRFVAGRDADALWVTDGATLHLRDSQVRGGYAAVRVDAGGSAWIRDVVVEGCVLAVEGAGAALHASGAVLRGNGVTARDQGAATLVACAIHDAQVAVDATGGAVVVAEETSMTGTPSAHLVQVTSSTVVLDRCTLGPPHETGVLAVNGGTAVLMECRVDGGITGLLAQDSARIDARRTRVSGAANTQVAAVDAGTVTCADCELSGGANTAEAVAGALRLDRCDVHGGASGIAAARRGSVDVRGGRITGGADYAIEAVRGTATRLEGTDLVPGGRGALVEPRRRGKVTMVEPALAPSGAHPDGAPAAIPYLWVAGRRGVSVFISAEDPWMKPLHAELEELDEANGHGLAEWVSALARQRFGDRAAGLELDPEAGSLSVAAEDPVLVVDVLDAMADALARRTPPSGPAATKGG